MPSDTILLFTRNGLGDGPAELQAKLAGIYLSLLNQSGSLPAKILFYTDGVKLACTGSPVLDQLRLIESQGVELILCKTCLDYYGLGDQVAVGIVGGMPDIIEAMEKAGKVISL
ncbi:MAG: DsrE family protein [Chloroflexi bacterium]|nr:DsrE family protein [Chloroflexota bacterium]